MSQMPPFTPSPDVAAVLHNLLDQYERRKDPHARVIRCDLEEPRGKRPAIGDLFFTVPHLELCYKKLVGDNVELSRLRLFVYGSPFRVDVPPQHWGGN
jgi:hypothetical protein